MVDKSKLSDYARELFELIINRHPDWMEFAKYVKYQAMYYWEKSSVEGFEINIPCPTKGNPPLIIEFYSPDDYTIVFGPTYIDQYDMELTHSPTALEIADKIDTVVEEIYSEQLISAEWKSFLRCSYFIDRDKYEHKLKEGKIIESVSWKGTYNYKMSNSI